MASTIHVDIVSAEAEIFSGEAEMVFAPAVEGEVGVAPRHTPLLTFLKQPIASLGLHSFTSYHADLPHIV